MVLNKEKELCNILMESNIMENEKMIKCMDKEHFIISMEKFAIKANFAKVNFMVMAYFIMISK